MQRLRKEMETRIYKRTFAKPIRKKGDPALPAQPIAPVPTHSFKVDPKNDDYFAALSTWQKRDRPILLSADVLPRRETENVDATVGMPATSLTGEPV